MPSPTLTWTQLEAIENLQLSAQDVPDVDWPDPLIRASVVFGGELLSIPALEPHQHDALEAVLRPTETRRSR